MAIFTGNILLDLFGVTIALFVVVYTFFQWNYQTWKRKNIPYFKPTFPYGNLPSQSKQKSESEITFHVVEKAKEQGWKFFGLYMLTRPYFVPLDLDMVKSILTKDFNHFVDRGSYYNEKDDPMSANLFTLGGARWKNLRSKLTPTFTSGKLRGMFQTLLDCGVLLEKFLKEHDREDIDIKKTLGCFTTDIIGSCAFGIDCNSLNEPDAPFVKNGQEFFQIEKYGILLRAFQKAFPNLSRSLHLKRIPPHISKFYYDVVTKTVNYREKNNYSRNDFLQILINLRKNEMDQGEKVDGTVLTMDEMAAQCFVFFVAGYETSSTTMTFALLELSLNPEIQEKVRKELVQTLKKYDNKMCYDALKELEYMQQVFDETLRKYPPAANLNRDCIEDYQIPNTDIILEKGTAVVIPVRNIHYDKNIYKDPETFDPERFNSENKKNRHQYAHIPFGEGPRMCIGARFALMQSKVGLATILKNYRLRISPKTRMPLELDPKEISPSAKGGIWLRLEKL